MEGEVRGRGSKRHMGDARRRHQSPRQQSGDTNYRWGNLIPTTVEGLSTSTDAVSFLSGNKSTIFKVIKFFQ